jgi:small subunit ribosomal protein S27Ae
MEKVINDTTYYLSLKLLGGKKKKKKKSYTSKKKSTHKHKATKCGTLNYYNVDGSGKVTTK